MIKTKLLTLLYTLCLLTLSANTYADDTDSEKAEAKVEIESTVAKNPEDSVKNEEESTEENETEENSSSEESEDEDEDEEPDCD